MLDFSLDDRAYREYRQGNRLPARDRADNGGEHLKLGFNRHPDQHARLRFVGNGLTPWAIAGMCVLVSEAGGRPVNVCAAGMQRAVFGVLWVATVIPRRCIRAIRVK